MLDAIVTGLALTGDRWHHDKEELSMTPKPNENDNRAHTDAPPASDLLQALAIESSRMNSLDTVTFAIKGWTITFVSALLGFSLEKENRQLIIPAVLSLVLFLMLDCYFRWIQLGHRNTNEKIKKRVIADETSSGSEPKIWAYMERRQARG